MTANWTGEDASSDCSECEECGECSATGTTTIAITVPFECDQDWDGVKESLFNHDENSDGKKDSCCKAGDCQIKLISWDEISLKLKFIMLGGEEYEIEVGDVDEPEPGELVEDVLEAVLKQLLKTAIGKLAGKLARVLPNALATANLFLDRIEAWLEVDEVITCPIYQLPDI